MAAQKVNSTSNINKPTVSDADLQAQIAEAATQFKSDKLVKVSIPKVLSKDLGDSLPLGVNGAIIVLPVDGKTYDVPETFANHLSQYLESLS